MQEPLTSFEGDVAATKSILDMQNGPTILVGHSYGSSVITEAGVDPSVVGLVYVAAHAPDVGENESALGKTMPSFTQKQPDAIRTTADSYTYLTRSAFPADFAADLPLGRAQFVTQAQVLTAVVASVDGPFRGSCATASLCRSRS